MLVQSTRNSVAIVHNQFQDISKYKRVLCVCSAGLLRSPTAARVLQEVYNYNTRAAGTYDYALIPISTALLEWADEVVFMERDHYQMAKYDNPEMIDRASRVLVLGIPDDYSYNQTELRELILSRYKTASSSPDFDWRKNPIDWDGMTQVGF